MSDVGAGEGADIDAIAARLREIASRLRSPELPEGEAEAIAREAADLVGRAGNEIDRALKPRSEEPGT
jgi:hypothetical protein